MRDNEFEELLKILHDNNYEKADVPTYSEILSFWESGHIPYFPPVEIKSKGGKFFGLPIEGFVAMQLATPKASHNINNSFSSEDSVISSIFDGDKMKGSSFFARESVQEGSHLFFQNGFAMYSALSFLKIKRFFKKDNKIFAKGDSLIMEVENGQNLLRVTDVQREFEVSKLYPRLICAENLHPEKRSRYGLEPFDREKYVENPWFKKSGGLPYLTLPFSHFSDGWSYKNTPKGSFEAHHLQILDTTGLSPPSLLSSSSF